MMDDQLAAILAVIIVPYTAGDLEVRKAVPLQFGRRIDK
jgi:hypothetical protein